MKNHTIKIQSHTIPVAASGPGWLAVDKPAGLSVHNAPGRDLCALVTEYLQQAVEFGRQIRADSGFGVHPAHRLDQGTSGIIILTATPQARQYWTQLFESRQVTKRYEALVHGRLTPPAGTPPSDTSQSDPPWGTWSWPLSKTAGGRRNPAGAGTRVACTTHYRLMGYSTHYSRVVVELVTGRKHQIRRHAKLAGHPLVGDLRYGSRRAVDFLRRHQNFDRLALHARVLTCRPPRHQHNITIATASIPDAMVQLFQRDRQNPNWEQKGK